MIIWIGILFIAGLLIGRFLRTDETCPRKIVGYNCKGDFCDHSKSKLYEAKMHMAMNDERIDSDRLV